ncbi:hypothetical protein niasHS_016396 [Heterodera schachtii]|uniref:Uncharacterized protein n=1 Tax=Heterodera schachtii TaxID=97005 RepID=A0ABD2HUF2_HETSC
MLTSPQFHAGMAERANRSIKERLYRYFTERGTYKWIEVTRQIHSGFVYHENYNSTPNGKLDSLLLYILILGLRLVLLNNNLSKLNGKQEIRSFAREKRAETSKIPLRIGPDLDVLEEMIRAKLNEEIKNMVEEDRTILDATKEMGMEAWVQAYRKGLESGNRVLINVLEGKDLKESLVSEGATDKWVAIEDTDVKVSTIQGIGQTFVQQLKVTVGNTEVYDSGNLYPFKAYITNELSFPVNAKKNFLGSTGYYHTERHNDETDDGFKERCKVFKGGNSAQFLSRLDFDLGNQELYLLNNLDLLFTIYKAKDAFLLQTLKANDDTKYRLTVHDVKIYAKMIEVQPSLNMNLYKTLEKQPATYAVRSTIPRRVTIALVSNSAFNGDYKLTPFKFDPFDLREISVHAGGMTIAVDLSLLRSGTTSIRATFDYAIPKGGVEMIVLGEFDQMIMIDYNRHIVVRLKAWPVQQPHQQPDADAELQAQIEDAEEEDLL